jgi:hypothetical protein
MINIWGVTVLGNVAVGVERQILRRTENDKNTRRLRTHEQMYYGGKARRDEDLR